MYILRSRRELQDKIVLTRSLRVGRVGRRDVEGNELSLKILFKINVPVASVYYLILNARCALPIHTTITYESIIDLVFIFIFNAALQSLQSVASSYSTENVCRYLSISRKTRCLDRNLIDFSHNNNHIGASVREQTGGSHIFVGRDASEIYAAEIILPRPGCATRTSDGSKCSAVQCV